MMTIFIKYNELEEFIKIIKQFGVRHGPFRKGVTHTDGGHVGYYIEVLNPGAAETYLKLKYNFNKFW